MPNEQSNTSDQSVVNTGEKTTVVTKQADNTYKEVSKLVYFTNLKVSNNGSLFSKAFPREITFDQLRLIQVQKPKIKLDEKTMLNEGSYFINSSKTKEYTTRIVTDKDGKKVVEPLAPKDYWKQAFYYPKGANSLDFVL